MLSKLVRSLRRFSGRTWQFLALVLAVGVVAGLAWCSEPSEGASSKPKGISVGRMTFCRSIKDREPQEVGEKFPNDLEKVFCFTVIVNAGAETHVVHKWYHGDKLMVEVTLKAQGEYWRTWSSKRMTADLTGTWRVDVVSAAGKVLKSASFELVAAGTEAEEEVEAEEAETDEEPVDEDEEAPDDEDEGDGAGDGDDSEAGGGEE